jgi:hypothetical protein
LPIEAAVDGGGGDGIFAAAANADDKMVAAASTTAGQLRMTATIAATTISQQSYCHQCHCVIPSIPLPPPLTMTTINKDHHHCGRH